MIPAYKKKLVLQVWNNKVGVEKIDIMALVIYGMTTANFSLLDKYKKDQVFAKNFMLVNTNIKIVLSIYFFLFSNIDVHFFKNEIG